MGEPNAVKVQLRSLSVVDIFRGPAPQELVVAVQEVASRGRVVHWSKAAAPPEWNLCRTVVQGDVRVSVFGRKGLPKTADLQMARREEAQLAFHNGERPIAGKERGCLFCFFFHTAFLKWNSDGKTGEFR